MLFRSLAMEGLDPPTKAHAYNVLSGSFASTFDQVKWLSKGIENWPYEISSYYNRANQYKVLGQRQKAAADRAKVDTLNKAHVLFEESKLAKDPAKAVRLAQEACQLTNYGYYLYVESLANAHYRNGNHAEAVRWGEKAWKLVESWPEVATKSRLASNLHYYRKAAAEK